MHEVLMLDQAPNYVIVQQWKTLPEIWEKVALFKPYKVKLVDPAWLWYSFPGVRIKKETVIILGKKK